MKTLKAWWQWFEHDKQPGPLDGAQLRHMSPPAVTSLERAARDVYTRAVGYEPWGSLDELLASSPVDLQRAAVRELSLAFCEALERMHEQVAKPTPAELDSALRADVRAKALDLHAKGFIGDEELEKAWPTLGSMSERMTWDSARRTAYRDKVADLYENGAVTARTPGRCTALHVFGPSQALEADKVVTAFQHPPEVAMSFVVVLERDAVELVRGQRFDAVYIHPSILEVEREVAKYALEEVIVPALVDRERMFVVMPEGVRQEPTPRAWYEAKRAQNALAALREKTARDRERLEKVIPELRQEPEFR